MLGVTLLTVGKLKEDWLVKGVGEYAKRLGAYCRFTIIELPEHRLPLKPSEKNIELGLEKEALAIIEKIPPRARVITLCIEGQQMSSEKLAKAISNYSNETSELVFIIGSSHGLSPEVKALSALRLSFSPMTFPHQLARLIAAEQLYRSFSILEGSKYHK